MSMKFSLQMSPVSRNFSFPSLKVCTYAYANKIICIKLYQYTHMIADFELIELTILRINGIEV